MASFVVMEPPRAGGRREAVVVRDGFHFLAFIVPVLWLLWHRLWFEALAALAAALALAGLGSIAGYGSASSLLSLLVAIYVGLEGVALRLAALRRRGWREWGVVEADNAGDAEIRYLAEVHGGAVTDQTEAPAPMPAAPGPTVADTARRAPPALSGPALGLFSYPQGR